MTKCQHCDADILQPNRMGTTPWHQEPSDDEKIDHAEQTLAANRMGTTPEMQKMYDEFDGLGWREYMRGIENGNIDPTGERLRAVCKLAREALAATPAQDDAVLDSYADENQRFSDRIEELEARLAAATPAVGGLAEATIELNGLLDKYWMGDISKTNIIAMCAAQQKCKNALAATPAVGGERCLTCDRTDKEYLNSSKMCPDPWHGDFHLREKAAAQPASPLRGRNETWRIIVDIMVSHLGHSYPMLADRIADALTAPASPLRGREIDQQWIKSLIHSEYDPKPSYYKPGDDWNDGTDEIAKRIAERYASPPEQPAADPEETT